MAEPSRAVSKEIEGQHKTQRSMESAKEEAGSIDKYYSASARGLSKGTHNKSFHVEAPKFLTFNLRGPAGSQNISPNPW
jgi:hypothetical protein